MRDRPAEVIELGKLSEAQDVLDGRDDVGRLEKRSNSPERRASAQ